MEDITYVDYRHAKRALKNFNNKNISEYRDFYVQSNTLLLADVFENFRNKCIEIYELDPGHFLSPPELAWQLYLKKTGQKLKLLTDFDMLLVVKKGIRGGICHAVHKYAKANNIYMKKCNKDKESSYIMYLNANNLYGWAMSQKLPVNGSKWKENTSKFNTNLIKKNYDEDSNK